MVSQQVLNDLFGAFPNAIMNRSLEFVAEPNKYVNSYFRLEDCESREDVTAKVLEWLSREAYKSQHYHVDWRNKQVHEYHLRGINTFCGTNFTHDDIEIIYTRLGNCVNHGLTLDFIHSGYDMSVLEWRGRMNAVLTSIQPPHTTNIFDEIKKIEWRTKQMPTGKHYVYETKNGGGIGKVIGECKIWRIHKYDNVSLIPEGYIDAGCVPYGFLEQYAKGKPLYAHFIVSAKRYDKPKDLIDFYRYCGEDPKCDGCKYLWVESNESVGYYEQCCSLCEGYKPLERPPQSWCYVEEA